MSNNKKCNTNCYTGFDSNFEEAYVLCQKEYSHSNLLEMLKNGNIMQKQLAALKFDYINDTNDVQALLNNLTGCDGKIREATAQRINNFLTKNNSTRALFAEQAAKIFADASIDINANICRLVIDNARLISDFKNFSEQYSAAIVKYTMDALTELDKFIFKDKKYVINKQLFKLYWCLEAINFFYEFIPHKTLEHILSECCKISEYTIREKTAQILIKLNDFELLKQKLSNDTNYYVREVFTSSKHL